MTDTPPLVAAFASKLIVDADGGLPYTLVSSLLYDSALLNRRITIEAGFRTDLASIPRICWNVLPPFGAYSAAAVVHDGLYQLGIALGFGVTRAQADAVLHEAMHVLKVPRLQRWAIYYGVRAGGWLVWAKYRAKDAQNQVPL